MDKELVTRTDKRMDATVADFKQKLATVRTGRATLAILDGISIDYYGTPTPLNQVAKLSVPDPTLLTAQPFDPAVMATIEKAIQASDLGLNPSNDGKVIRIPIPPLTEERRKLLVRKVHAIREEAKTAVRQIRRDANEETRKMEKESSLSEDDAHRTRDDVQKKTDAHVAAIDEVCKNKENELLEI
jgi:ribosome recycling factor